jgi:hypothetical protein
MADVTVKVRAFPLVRQHKKLKSPQVRKWLGRLTNNDLAERWLNREYIEAYRNVAIPELSDVARRVVDDLTANGVAFSSVSEFFGGDTLAKLTDAFNRYHEQFKANDTGARKGKQVYLATIHRAHTFVADDFVSDYLGSEQYAALAARYLEMIPRFVGNSFWHTYPAPIEERMYSQLWHRDYNDRQLVKVFLYVNDVDETNGPFEYLSGAHRRGPLGGVFNRIGPDGLRAYPDSGEMERFLPPYPVVKLHEVAEPDRYGSRAPWAGKPSRILCTGPAGTLIFADTFGLHRGGYVQEGYRNLIMTTFSTNANVHRPHFEVTLEFAQRLSPFMRRVFAVKVK